MDQLDPAIQHYAWGDLAAIPSLLGRPGDGRPWAELWLGTHHSGPSTVHGRSLHDVIADDPHENLGPETAQDFGALPFLLKVLAAAKPLSIQAHPSRQQAQAGFALEQDRGVDRGDPTRVYRDSNHKPELICALTPFHAKCGFRDLDATRRLFAQLDVAALQPLRDILQTRGQDAAVLGSALAYLLRLPAADRIELVHGTVGAAQVAESEEFSEDLSWVGVMNESFPQDIGVVVALLLNHVTLQPGEAVFLPAGNLHSYLCGTGVEIMANSDNVLRGGCTPKHIAIDELLAVVDPSPMVPDVQRPVARSHRYHASVRDFSLTRHDIEEPVVAELNSAEIVLVTDGSIVVTSGDDTLTLERGQAAFLPHSGEQVRLEGLGVAFQAGVGQSLGTN